MENYQKQSAYRVMCSEVNRCVGQRINLQGWVHRIRQLGKIAFLHIRDRSGIIQCVLEGEWAQKSLSLESVVAVKGEVVAAEKSPGGFEVIVQSLEVLNQSESPLPFEVNKDRLNVNLDTMLDHRVLSLRNQQEQVTFKVQSVLAGAFRDYLTGQGFMQIFTPKIVAAGAEGGANVFSIEYFEQKAYLAQSPQFYKQMMVGAGYERVFEIAPVYRAEEHNTSRHLNEYTSLDLEMGFIASEEELMNLEEDMLRYMLQAVRVNCREELKIIKVEVPEIGSIPRLTVAEAQQILQEQYGKSSPKGDLDPEGERLICHYFEEKENSAFVFLTRYPREIRPMYAMPAADNAEETASFDLLFKGLEITTGGQRIHNHKQLIESIKGRGMNPESFSNYTDVFKYGMPPHGGLAIGLERLTSKLLDQTNVRLSSAFPRDRHRLTP
ncbi:aspartate--tRNA(Asn) ligase [Cytobacillus purgationiresistens]|uniref:Aspartate--tRNA(Asp/Asn) ligase n=1 Tax=Cytobacillus purgationiresistens TaxID=863449 RepID=A0ABU0ANR2_9BACI|nr:aspartate--tRNA(Asn) ligase [Cytobacillus purgationiresistens]MDQ0272830.1 nondiscriminating aspartyl-tRNA synthetase [Cytobacillus purgationiresistens]